MSFGETIGNIFHIDISELQQALNPSAFTWDSLPGMIVLLVLIGLGVMLGRKIGRAVWYGFLFVVMIEILHIFAFSTIGKTYLPFMQDVFKYHVLQSLAQLCVGTPVATALLFIQEFLNSVVGLAFDAVLVLWNLVWPPVRSALENIYKGFGG